MKKTLCILLTVLMLSCLLTACAAPKPAPAPAAPAAGDAAAPAAPDAPAGEEWGEPIVITFASFHMENELDTVAFTRPWLDEIEKACAEAGYDVTFECYWGGTLCSVAESYQAVIDGTADMALFLTAMPGVFELEQALMFAWNGKDVPYPSEFFYTLYQEFPEIQEEYSKVHPIAFLMEPPQKVNSNKSFTNLAESKGSVWSSTGSVCSLICKEWGWSPASVPPEDAYSSMERGIVDGVTGTAKTWCSMAWYEIVKNRYMNLAMTNQMVSILMNLDKWNSLPAGVQEIINDFSSGGSWNVGKFYNDAMTQIELEYEPKLVGELGMNPVELSEEAVAEFQAGIDAAAKVWAEQFDAQGKPGTKIIERIQELVAEQAQ